LVATKHRAPKPGPPLTSAAASTRREGLLTLLRGMPLLAALPERALQRLSQEAGQVTAGRGDVICRQGDSGDCLYIVERGNVEIVVSQSNGAELTVAKLAPGEFFGELALLDGEPRSATARAASRATLMSISRKQFLDVVREPGVLENLLLVLSQRLRSADKLVADRAVDNVRLLEVARVDTATGLGNGRKLEEDLEELRGRAQRYGHSYAIAIIKIDLFDEYGQLCGQGLADSALHEIGSTIAGCLRSADAAYHKDDAEFVVVMPEQTAESAAVGIRRICQRVQQLRIAHSGSPLGVLTLSAGLAALGHGEDGQHDAALAEAQQALSRAQRNGRSRVELSA
jgi:diguanylate cyclase (GGDEF)-like protein